VNVKRLIPRRVKALYRRLRRRLRAWALSRLGAVDAELLASYFNEALESYSMVDYRGKVVVDIGADWGSSCMYFLARDASKVIAFDTVRPHLPLRHVEWHGQWNGERVPGDILKVDCEGCECNADPSLFFSYPVAFVAVHKFAPCYSELSARLAESCRKVFTSADKLEEMYLCENNEKKKKEG